MDSPPSLIPAAAMPAPAAPPQSTLRYATLKHDPHRTASVEPLTVAEYFALDAASERKWEYYQGYVRAMAGASFSHSLIAGNAARHLGNALVDGRCTTHISDLRVAVTEKVYYYPDIVVVCGPPDLTDSRPEAVRNPSLVVEVLSDSTGARDRGEKLDAYQQIDSLHTYVLLWQNEARAQVWTRESATRWTAEHVHGLDAVLQVEALGLSLPLAEVYRNVELGGEA